jgi:hypothetical protein
MVKVQGICPKKYVPLNPKHEIRNKASDLEAKKGLTVLSYDGRTPNKRLDT